MKNAIRLCLILLCATSSVLAQTQHDRIKSRGASTFDQYSNTSTIIITGATPSITGGNVFKTNNGSAVTITNFLGGVDSQQIVVLCGDGNTTIQNNANIVVTGGTNFACTANVGIAFVFDASQSKWIENGGTGTGGGGGGSPAAPEGALQRKTGSNFGASAAVEAGGVLSIDDSLSLLGPDPYSDIRRYGKFANFSSTTATTTSGQPTVSLASAQSFLNGEYVTVYNAGPATSLSSMGTVTLTPSLNAGGLNSVAAAAGSSSFSYKVIAADKFGGYTAASTAAATSTGNALGMQTVNITSMSRSGNRVVTVTTASAHPFVVGSMIFIQFFGGNSDNTFNGWFIVASVPDSTHFTYVGGFDIAGGASTSDSGGKVIGFTLNHLTWTAVNGAFKYFIYGRTGGAFNLIGVTTLTFFDDFGSPMEDNQLFSTYIPTTAPSSGANDHLTAKIVSGAGTTTLTLNANAGASLSGVTAISDDGPAWVAACANGTAYIPNVGATVNSYTQLGSACRTVFNGNVTVEDTIELHSNSLQGNSFGSCSAFAWGCYPTISSHRAYPIISVPNPGANIRHMNIGYSSSNGGLVITDSGNSSVTDFTIEDSAIGSGSGSIQDYVSMQMMFQNSGFSFRFDQTTWLTGDPGANNESNIGFTPIPSIVFKNFNGSPSAPTSNFFFQRSWFINRSSIDQDYVSGSAGINWVLMKDIQSQNQFLPLVSQTGSGMGGGYDIEDITPADFPSPFLACLNGNANAGCGAVTMKQISCVQGGYLSTNGYFPGSSITAACTFGQNVDYVTYSSFNNAPVTVNNTGTMGYAMTQTAQPASVTGVSGGQFSAGAHTVAIAWVDAFNRFASFSKSVSVTLSGGNLNISVVPPSAPAGAVGYLVIVDGLGRDVVNGSCSNMVQTPATATATPFGQNCNGFGPFGAASTPSYSAGFGSLGVETNSLKVTGGGGVSTITANNLTANRAQALPDLPGTFAIVNAAQTWSGAQSNMPLTAPAITNGTATGLALTTPTLGGETISSSPRGPFNVVLPGALTATSTNETWTLDKAITVTRVQVQLKTAPSGCSTAAIVRLSDGTSNVNLTISAATNDSGAISQNYAAAAVLTFTVQTAAAGCTTSPGDANVVVQYKMQ